MGFQVKTTHYVRSTTSPVWDCRAQFLVQDYTQVSLSFVIYSWNIVKSMDTDMLGLAMLSLSQVIKSFLTKPNGSQKRDKTIIKKWFRYNIFEVYLANYGFILLKLFNSYQS